MYKIVKRIVGMYWRIHYLWERKCLFNMPHGSFYISRPNINGIDRVYRKMYMKLGKGQNSNLHADTFECEFFLQMKTDAWNNKKAIRSLFFHDTWSFVHWPPVKAKITLNIWTWQKNVSIWTGLYWQRNGFFFGSFFTHSYIWSCLLFILVY